MQLLYSNVYRARVGERAPDAASLVLVEHDSAAFGDGSHPTTRLCARAVDLLCRSHPGCAVLDVGTGTGILARVARARGATRIVATDIDAAARAAAMRNIALDHGARVPIAVTDAAPDAGGAPFHVVVANILEGVLAALAPALVAALVPGGVLVLSGFTAPQTPFVRARFTALGVTLVQQAEHDGWHLVVVQAPRQS